MDKHFLPGYKMAPEMVPTSSSLLERAGRDPSGIDTLRKVSLGYEDLDPTTHAFVLSKLKPYAPGPGFDNMIFVAREEGTVGSMDQLPAKELSTLLGMSGRLLSVYEHAAEANDPIISEIVAVNYHPQPLGEQVFDRKLHAQTLKDLHLHVLAFRSSDVEELPSLRRKDIQKEAFTELRDPIVSVMDHLVALPGIQKRVLYNLERLNTINDADYSGIHLDAGNTGLGDPDLSQDLLQLHENVQNLYTHIANLFVDLDTPDASGMPSLRSVTEREARLRVFFEELGFESPKEAKRLERAFLRMNKDMKSGEELLRMSPEERSDFPIFLRGLAYTLALIKDPATGHLTVNLGPRLLSTGNLLATLGYSKVAKDLPPQAWINEKRRNEEMIRVAMTPASSAPTN